MFATPNGSGFGRTITPGLYLYFEPSRGLIVSNVILFSHNLISETAVLLRAFRSISGSFMLFCKKMCYFP